MPAGDSLPVETTAMMTWDEAINDWLSYLRLRGLSPRTIRLRDKHLRYVAARTVTSPSELTCEVLRGLFAAQSWSLEYRKSMRASAVSFCAHHRLCDGDDCLPAVRSASPRPRPVTDELWRKLTAETSGAVRLMIRLAGEAGLRRAEVAGLHTDDLAPEADGWSLIIKGKGGKQRIVPIGDDLAAELQELPRGYVFPSRKGDGHLQPESVGRIVSRLMPPGWSMHKLRHRAATRGHAGTGNLRATQEFLGHASVATTQRYVAVSSRDVRAVSEAASWRP